jgi:predicted amidohydrolase YtcJ
VDDDKAGQGVIELGGRCLLPGFTDSHVHFPTWSLGLRQARLEGARSLEEALDRVVAARDHVRDGGWLRGLGWREGDWTEPPTREALDSAVPDVPVALMSKDYHSLWLNSAALECADGPLEVPGGVVEESGILRENAAWAFRDRYVRPTLDEMVEASREGMRDGGVARRRRDP